MNEPCTSVNYSSDPKKYKVNIVIMGTGVQGYKSGWAYAGIDNAGYPYLMCDAAAMTYNPITWVTPHELGHVMQFAQGNNWWQNNGYLGPWYEAVANWFREQYLYSSKYTANTNYATDLSAYYLRQTNLMACNGRAYYEAWPILQYLEDNPENFIGYGKGFVGKMLNNGSKTDTIYDLIENLNSNANLSDTIGYFASHMSTIDFKYKNRYKNKFNQISQRIENGQPQILMFEPGTAEVLEIQCNIVQFHDEEISGYHDSCLASDFFEDWISSNPDGLEINECAGYKVMLFLSGEDTLQNLEKSDMDVYWSICSQLILKTKDLPEGAQVKGIEFTE